MASVLFRTVGPKLCLTGLLPSGPTNLASGTTTATTISGTYSPSATNPNLPHVLQYTPFGEPAQRVVVSGGTFLLTGLTGNVTYTLQVFAEGAFGEVGSNQIQVTTPLPGAPNAPVNLKVNPVPGINSVVGLVWEPGDSLETTFRIERLDPGLDWQTLDVVSGGTFAYVDIGINPNSTYQYQVHAINVSGVSNASNAVSVTTAAAYSTSKPNDPTGLSVTAQTATTALVSWTNNATGNYAYRVFRQDPGSLRYRCVKGNATATSFTDVGLAPGAVYTYRAMAVSTATSNPTNYTAAVSVTMPARANGAPVEPSSVKAERMSATTVQVSWTDNSGGSAQFEVSHALWNAGLSNSFSVDTTTSAGVTSYTVTGLTAETPYRFRVRAKSGTVFSDYGTPDDGTVVGQAQQRMHGAEYAESTASGGLRQAQTITVGVGKQYATPDLVPTNSLEPGDVIEIDAGSYQSLVLLSCSGTRANPITIRCTGGVAQLNAAGATASADYTGRSAVWGLGALHVGKRAGMTFGYTPRFLVIQNIRTSNAYTGNTFTTSSSQNWTNGSAGIYLEGGSDVSITGCEVDNNGNGVFGAGQSTFDRFLASVTIGSDSSGNFIHGNSGTGSPFSHQTYVEAIGISYVGNNYGAPRAGSVGIDLKERSVGVTVRNNKFSGGQHCLQFAESQNTSDLADALDARLTGDVFGNEFYVEPGNSNSPAWFGGDQGNTQIQRPAVYRFYHNTVVDRNDQTGSPSAFKVVAVKVSSPMGILDARNNIYDGFPNTAGHTPSDFGLSDSSLAGSDGGNYTAYFGATWAPPGWKMTTGGTNETFTGQADGTANVLTGVSTDPGFVDQQNGDYHLQSNSACVGVGTRLPAGVSVTRQYHAQNTVARPTSGAGSDLGAYAQGVT